MTRPLLVAVATVLTLLDGGCKRADPLGARADASQAPTVDSGSTSSAIDAGAGADDADPQRTAARAVRDATSLHDAFAAAVPFLAEKYENDKPSLGWLVLTSWATKNLKWSDVAVVKDETSYGLAQKDPVDARGKRLCRSGKILHIKAFGEGLEKFFSGMLAGEDGAYEFFAVRSSGTLVEGGRARFCGAAAGVYRYSAQTIGGAAQAIAVIGMFDLPENK